jgi:hypothetical protein
MVATTSITHKTFVRVMCSMTLLVLLCCQAFGQSLEPPRILSEPRIQTSEPRIQTRALILNPAPTACRPNPRLAYGWMARDAMGRRWDFALVPVDCGPTQIRAVDRSGRFPQIPVTYLLHISAPGGDPRRPQILTLHLSDFNELAGSEFTVLFAKSWLSDRWDEIKDLADKIVGIIKPLIKDLKEIIGDAKELWKDIQQLVRDARPLTAMLMGKAEASALTRKAFARFLAAEAQSLRNKNLMPHQRLGSSLATAMQQDPHLVMLFADAARTLTKGR